VLYAAVAARSFRRFSTYRAATLTGIFTNSVFGVIFSFAYRALWNQQSHGGYDPTDAITYVWIGQALLMTVAVWGGGTTDDLAERIRTGDVAIDLYRPVGLIGWYLAGDLGRASYHFLARGLGPTVLGVLLFHITLPDGPVTGLAFLVSLALAVVTSFAIRFLVACSAFWLLDQTGVRTMSGVLALFWSGMVLPLVIFPEPLRTIAFALPWASYLQTPADIWLGHRTGVSVLSALGVQVIWIAVLLALCQAVLGAATRKVVVQGG
jgi:viologen exporter family transport system permease protein